MTQDPTPNPHAHRATPDTFVGVAPVNWGLENTELLAETHGMNWQEHIDFHFDRLDDEDGLIARGEVSFEDGGQAKIVVEEPLEELHTLAGTSKEPYTPTEVVLLKEHTACWRIMIKGGQKRSPEAARRFGRLASTLVEAGAAGFFMPGLVCIQSPRLIKRATMQLEQPQSLTNLCVHAWHEDDWMMTRGLTAFGLPELETPIDEGMNAAYFRLMDVAAGMIAQNATFPDDARLDIGPKSYAIADGQQGPRDEQVPFSGTFGVHCIQPSG